MNNQQRRAAKAKQRRHRASGLRPEHVRPVPPAEDVLVDRDEEQQRRDEAYALLQSWSFVASALALDSVRRMVARDVRDRDPEVLVLVEVMLVDELGARLARAYEHGWEPRDLVHAARKGLRAYAVALVLAHAGASRVHTRAPQRWRDQLAALGPVPGPAARWTPIGSSAGDPVAVWADLLRLVRFLAELYPLEPIAPPPSRWGRAAGAPSAGPSTGGRDRVLAKIRALLAKAESTEHPAEAETFTAKAQELMTRHAVDEALLRSGQHEEIPVETRRVHLEAPYATVKASLLAAVARPNRCRTILMDPHDICALVGTPLDVDQTELLFTSLLIQATRAMAEAGTRRAGSYDRSPTFRRSFLMAYAVRIGERLEEADRSTTASYGAELVPLLQREADAVTAEFERRFPHVRTSSSSSYDARGWAAGRDAADRARIAAGQISA